MTQLSFAATPQDWHEHGDPGPVGARLRRQLEAALAIASIAALTWAAVRPWGVLTEATAEFEQILGVVVLTMAGAGLAVRALWGNQPVEVGIALLSLLVGWMALVALTEDNLQGAFAPRAWSRTWQALDAGADQARTWAPPVPERFAEFPLLLASLAVAGFALLVVWSLGLRRPLVGVVIAVAVSLTPVALAPTTPSVTNYVVLAAAALLLLWSVPADPASDLPGLGQPLRTAGLAAVAIVLALPLAALVPRADRPDVSRIGEPARMVRVENPLVDLRRDLSRPDDTPLLRFRTNDPSPRYLRIAVLDEYDGGAWKPSARKVPESQQADGNLPAPVGVSDPDRWPEYGYRFQATPAFRSQWLVQRYPSTSIQVAGDWRFDRNTLDVVAAAGQTTSGLSYRTRGRRIEPSAADLAASRPGENLSVSAPVPELVGALARRVVRNASATRPFAQAQALQEWFRTPHTNPDDGPSFQYDLSRAPAGSSDDALLAFLTDRRGYCEQFAATMALMAQELGIPARVSVGFLEPRRVAGGWELSSDDLHAWPELFFVGAGWVAFEPTPSDRSGATAPSYTNPREPGATNPSQPSPPRQTTPAAPDDERAAPSPPRRTPSQESGVDAGADQSMPLPISRLPLALLGLVIVVALTPRILWVLLRRQRRRRAAEQHAVLAMRWRELMEAAAAYSPPQSAAPAGLGSPHGGSPRSQAYAVIAAVASAGTEESEALASDVEALATKVEQERFGSTSPGLDGDDERTLERVSRALWEQASWPSRVGLWLWPPGLIDLLGFGPEAQEQEAQVKTR